MTQSIACSQLSRFPDEHRKSHQGEQTTKPWTSTAFIGSIFAPMKCHLVGAQDN